MSLRRTLIAIITVLSLFVVIGGVVLAILVQRARADAPAGLILVAPQSLALIDGYGMEQSLANDADTAQYRFPAVAPDGQTLAYVATAANTATIERLTLVDRVRQTIFRSDSSQPFNLAFSPDGRYLTFLVADTGGLGLFVLPADGSAPASLVTPGQPAYYAWRADGSALLIHIGGHAAQGGQLVVYTPGQQGVAALRSDPGLFQAPAYSRSGEQIFYIMQPAGPQLASYRDTTAQLVRIPAVGGTPTALLSETAAELRLARDPVSDHLAVLTAAIDGQDTIRWGGLRVVDGAAGGAPRTLSRPGEQVAACFWSPDGRYIAYLTHDERYAGDTPRTLRIVDVASGMITDYPEFAPSEAQLQLEVFFDAYHFSLTPWSPDGRRFAYGSADGIYVVDLGGGVRRAGAGTLGVWGAR